MPESVSSTKSVLTTQRVYVDFISAVGPKLVLQLKPSPVLKPLCSCDYTAFILRRRHLLTTHLQQVMVSLFLSIGAILCTSVSRKASDSKTEIIMHIAYQFCVCSHSHLAPLRNVTIQARTLHSIGLVLACYRHRNRGRHLFIQSTKFIFG